MYNVPDVRIRKTLKDEILKKSLFFSKSSKDFTFCNINSKNLKSEGLLK